MGNCVAKKPKGVDEEAYDDGAQPADQTPAAAGDELESVEETDQHEAQAMTTNEGSSPAPPLVMVDIKENKRQMEAANKQVRNEWYEFGVDEKVCELLRQAEMEHYIPNFAFHQIEYETLRHLTVDDLKDMNVNRVGHRRKLLLQFDSQAGTRKIKSRA